MPAKSHGLNLPYFTSGALDDIAHDRIVKGIKDTRSDRNTGDGGQLRCRQPNG